MSKTQIVSHRFVTLVNKEAIPVDAPDKILVVPWGSVESKSGDFVVDQSVANDIISAFKNHGVDLVIDLEHQTLGDEFSSPDGAAPAMGWIKSFSVEVGRGIVALVEWTKRGMNYVQEKEYRYLSPTLSMIVGPARPVELHSVALTNKPAIVGMTPIVNKQELPRMDRTDQRVIPHSELGDWIRNQLDNDSRDRTVADLASAAGIAEGTMQGIISGDIERPPDARLSAIAEFFNVGVDTVRNLISRERLESGQDVRPGDDRPNKETVTMKHKEVILALRESLGIAPEIEITSDMVLERINELKTAHADKAKGGLSEERDVLAKAVNEAHEKIKILTENNTDREAGERIEKAMSEGKLTEAMIKPATDGSNHFLTLARDKAGWDQFIERQPVVKPPQGSVLSSNRQGAPAARPGRGDAILAHSDRYDQDRIGEYERIKAHQKEHKVSYQEAMEACSA